MLHAQRVVRNAGLISMAAPLVEFLRYLFNGLVNRNVWHRDEQADFVPNLLLLLSINIMLLGAVWWLAYPLVYKLSAIFHGLIGRWTSLPKWQRATDQALWPLPYAAAAGVAIWFFYFYLLTSSSLPAYFSDWIAGSMAHVLGAWCYLTIGAAWFRLWRSTCQESPRSHARR